MTDEILQAVRRCLVDGRRSPLASLYADECVLESYVSGRREVVVGSSAVSQGWLELVPESGTATHFSVEVMTGGYDIDMQWLTRSGGRQVRRLHRLEVVDRRVARHLVYPARPKEQLSLAPDSLGSILADSIVDLPHQGFSGASLFRAKLDSGEPVVVKHIRPGQDWLATASRDTGREARLHVDGVYSGLPPEISSPVLDAVPLTDGWLIVMRDVQATLDVVRSGGPASIGDTLLAAAHRMHVAFTGAPPIDSLCTMEDRLRLFSPLRPLVERRGEDMLPKTLTTAWECFADHAGASLSDAVLRLVVDPAALVRALREEAPATLLHGDYRSANLGIDASTVIALDWGLAAHGPAELDFVWFVSNTAWADDEERTQLESVWERLTGTGRDSRVLDLAVIYHAVMGEVAFVMSEARHQPAGFPKPSPETVTWWLRRLEQAFERVGDLG